MKIKLTLLIVLFGCIQLNAQELIKFNLKFDCYDEDSVLLTDYYSKIITGDSSPLILNKDAYTFKGRTKCILVISKFGYVKWMDTLILDRNTYLKIVLKEKAIEQSALIARTTRVDKNSAFAYTDISGKELKVQNLGQDFTYLIANTPSAVTTSDAGAGVGYTGIRIRGSDATRINVTINGIPINDAESHGVYWVNMPDLASSANSVQIQRGVGTSTNGNGSFGANISINNIENNNVPFVQMQQSFGSFNTMKSNLKFGTGKLGNFSFNGRLSGIRSDGYIDRASSDLAAYQFNLNYYKNKWAVNAVSFGGKEKTYQAWNGTPQSRYDGNKEAMQAYSDRNYLTPDQQNNLLNSGRTYNYFTYKNQTDNYWQNHYQLHLGKEMKKGLMFKTSFFTTTGKGYYEEYKEGASYASYGVPDYISPKQDTVSSTDLIRQKWLDNIYYGNFTSLDYNGKALKLSGGAGITRYQGRNFGKVIWAEFAQPFGNDREYYTSSATKNEVNGFLKAAYKVSNTLNLMAEMQMRDIHYKSDGIGSDLKKIKFDQHYTFMNPKLGFNCQVTRTQQLYGSFSMGNREPVRSDFTDNTDSTLPKPEQLKDYEFGWIMKGKHHFFQANAYYMDYVNQLVLTGDVNDVGTPLRKNVKQSYRMGIELIAMRSFFKDKTVLEGNLTLSQNRIRNFRDVYYDYDVSGVITKDFTSTDISFSPNAIGYVGITDKHIKNFQIGLNLKYVGQQYLDNTSNEASKIASYSTLNMHFQKEFKLKNISSLMIKGMANNLASINYTNNGYTYKYVYGGELIRENFYYPQSKINFMLGVDVRF